MSPQLKQAAHEKEAIPWLALALLGTGAGGYHLLRHGTGLPPAVKPQTAQQIDQNYGNMLSNSMRLGLGGLGVGAAGAAGLSALNSATSGTKAKDTSRLPSQVLLSHVGPKEREERRRLAKVSAEVGSAVAREKQAEGPLDQAGQYLAKNYLPDAVKTDVPNAMWSAAGIPIALGATGLGLYGGWKGTDAVLDAMRASERDRDVARAKKRYQKALAAQFGERPKQAADATTEEHTADDIQFGDLYEKVAQPNDQWQSPSGTRQYTDPLIGAYLASMLGLGGLSWAATHAYTKGHDRNKEISRALERERRDRMRRKPAPLEMISGGGRGLSSLKP